LWSGSPPGHFAAATDMAGAARCGAMGAIS
jgi:hypothetical protein